MLDQFPYAHQIYPLIKPLKAEYRLLPVKNYAVFYLVREPEKVVKIQRILYAKRILHRPANLGKQQHLPQAQSNFLGFFCGAKRGDGSSGWLENRYKKRQEVDLICI